MKFNFPLRALSALDSFFEVYRRLKRQDLINSFGRNQSTRKNNKDSDHHHKTDNNLHGVRGKDDHIAKNPDPIRNSPLGAVTLVIGTFNIIEQVRPNPVNS